MSSAVELYAAGLAATDAPLVLRYPDGSGRVLPVRDWTAQELDGDASLLDRCTGPVLDVGCGPGRLTVAAGARDCRLSESTSRRQQCNSPAPAAAWR